MTKGRTYMNTTYLDFLLSQGSKTTKATVPTEMFWASEQYDLSHNKY